MRHKKSFNHLGRKVGHRNSMLANMASSLILHKRIKTTTAKAKALRVFVEPLITKSKDDSTHSRRVVFSYLQDKDAVSELFREVSPKVADRPGGYTRILKTGIRLGDNADMCVIELVDYNENLLKAQEDTAKSGRRRRRGGKKKTEELAAGVAATETVEETNDTEAAEEKLAETKEETVVENEGIESKEQTEDTIEEKTETIEEEVKIEAEPEVSQEEDKAEAEDVTLEASKEESSTEEKQETKEADDSEEKKAE